MDMEILNDSDLWLKRRLTPVLLLFILLGIGSCRKRDAKVKLPEVASKLVLVSFISPQDSIISVSITLSQPLYNNASSNNFAPVENAEVTISSDLGSATLSYDAVRKGYSIDSTRLKIREGFNYRITARTPDGKYALANTSIPPANKNLAVSLSSDSNSIRCSWPDPAGSQDYYRLLFQNSSYHIFEGYNQNGSFSDTIKVNFANSWWATDADRDGSVLTEVIDYSVPPFSAEGQKYYIYLLHVSKEYYEYGIHLPYSQNTGDPFQEPAPVYSNVTGGFGIFAGYNSYRIIP